MLFKRTRHPRCTLPIDLSSPRPARQTDQRHEHPDRGPRRCSPFEASVLDRGFVGNGCHTPFAGDLTTSGVSRLASALRNRGRWRLAAPGSRPTRAGSQTCLLHDRRRDAEER